MRTSLLLDTETFFDTLLTRDLPPGLTPVQDMQTDSYEEVPFVDWQAVNHGQYGFRLWSVTLALTIVAEPQAIYAWCAAVYETVSEWGFPGAGVVDDLAAVNTVEDGSSFTKVGQAMIHGKNLAQYAGSFTLTVQSAE